MAFPRSPSAPLALLLLLCAAFARPAVPEHKLFVQLLFQEARPVASTRPFAFGPGVARSAEPVTVGVPLPEEAQVRDLGNLVVVGSETTQLRPLAHWPDGSVRWLLLDLQVDLEAGEPNGSFYLTTGSGNVAAPDLAVPDADGGVGLDTGRLRARVVPDAGGTLVDELELDGSPRRWLPAAIGLVAGDGTLLAPEGPERVALEENGPLRAVVVVRRAYADATGSRLDVAVRLHFYRGRTDVRATLAVSVLDQVELGALRVIWSEPDGPVAFQPAPERELSFVTLRAEESFTLATSRPDERVQRTLTSAGQLYHEWPLADGGPTSFPRGATLQRELLFELSDDVAPELAGLRLSAPVVGRAATADAYGDAGVLARRLATWLEPSIDEERVDARELALDHLSAFGPAAAWFLRAAERALAAELERGAPDESTWAAARLVYHLGGDERLRAAARRRGEVLLAAGTPSDPAGVALALDLFRTCGDRRLLDAAWSAFSAGVLTEPGASETIGVLDALVAFGEPDERRADAALDALEGLALADESAAGLRLAYRQTGDRELLERAAKLLYDTPHGAPDRRPDPDLAALEFLVEHPERDPVWRELLVESRGVAEGVEELAWTVPPGAAAIRIKRGGSTPIERFHAAPNAVGEPAPGVAGEVQVWRVELAPGAVACRHFAARYLATEVPRAAGHAPATGVVPAEERDTEPGFPWRSAVCVLVALILSAALAAVVASRRGSG